MMLCKFSRNLRYVCYHVGFKSLDYEFVTETEHVETSKYRSLKNDQHNANPGAARS